MTRSVYAVRRIELAPYHDVGDEELWWNMDQGWVSRESATYYLKGHTKIFQLPFDGEWVEITVHNINEEDA